MFWNFENMAATVKATLRHGINGESVTLDGQWEHYAQFTVGKEYNGALQVLTDVSNGYVTVTYELVIFDTDDGVRFFAFRPEQVKEYWEVEPIFPTDERA